MQRGPPCTPGGKIRTAENETSVIGRKSDKMTGEGGLSYGKVY